MTTLLAYGSLCSGLGLRNLGRVAAQHVERVTLTNCRRGFGKLSQYGDRYAMVLEPLRSDEPIQVESVTLPASPRNVSALALTVSGEDLERIARREGYDPEVLRRLTQVAQQRGLTVSQHLWRMLESVGFGPAEYRRSLFEQTGYTSPHYIPHPVAGSGAEPALIFLPPGLEGSGDEAVVPVRVATGMVEVLSVRHAWRHKSNPSQFEYFSMCLLAEVHGLSLADVLYDLEPDSELAELLTAHMRREVGREPALFCATLGLSEDRYGALRSGFTADSWLLATLARGNGNAIPGRLCVRREVERERCQRKSRSEYTSPRTT
jgi:hypothetical protein